MTFRCFPLIVLLGALSTGAVQAQTPGPRPYDASFGGATVDPTKHHVLDFSFTASEGYDDNVLAVDSSPTVNGEAGFLTLLDPRLAYSWLGRSLKISATGGGDLRYYHTSQSFVGNTLFGTLGISADVARTQVSFAQAVYYTPSYTYGLFPSAGPVNEVAASGAYGSSGQQAVASDTELTVQRSLTPRSRVVALGGYSVQDLSNAPSQTSMRGYSAGGRFLFDLSREATVHAGYVYREGDYSFAPGQRIVIHDIDLGVDYRRALSFSRRTTVNFNVGSSLVNTPLDNVSGGTLTYRLGATASLRHDFGRSWRATAGYRRGIDMLAAVAGPVYSDGVNASLTGFFSRTTDLDVSGAFTRGNAGGGTDVSSRVQTYTVNARLRRALGRRWALFGEYVYYAYDFGSNVVVFGAIPHTLDRNTARAGVTLWVPLVRK